MSSLTEQSESETTNRKLGSSNGSTASPNLSQNAHGNRGTDTKGKCRMASRAAVLGTPKGGELGFLYFPYVCTKSDRSQLYLYLQMKKQLSIWGSYL